MSVIYHGRITSENSGVMYFQRHPGNNSQSSLSWPLILLPLPQNKVQFPVFKNQYCLSSLMWSFSLNMLLCKRTRHSKCMLRNSKIRHLLSQTKIKLPITYFFPAVLAVVYLKFKMAFYTWDKLGRRKNMKNLVKVLTV